MNDGDFISGRLKEWISEMEGADVQRALEASGHLLRRLGRAAGSVAEPDVARALRRLPPAEVRASAETIDVAGVEARLRRATDEAVEAALPEHAGEGETWAAWARADLEARDGLEARRVALEYREKLGFESEALVRARLAAALQSLDAQLSPRARRLVALNGWRRAMRDALDPAHRERAWWFTSRAECDDLLAVLAGHAPASGHVLSCDPCRGDLLLAMEVDAPRSRHLSEEDLWRYDLGIASQAERAFADTHAGGCPECGQALAALQDAERAIEEASFAAGGTGAVVPLAPRARSLGAEPEVLADHAAFRLLLFRKPGGMRLLVQPRQQGLVAAAMLELPTRALAARPSPDGLELDLAAGARTELRGLVRVRLSGAPGDVTEPVDLRE